MPKDDRAMTRAVRAGMAATGLTYTQMRAQILVEEESRRDFDEAGRDEAYNQAAEADVYDEPYFVEDEEEDDVPETFADTNDQCFECGGDGGRYGCSC